MCTAQLPQAARARRGESQPNDPVIDRVRPAVDEARVRGTIDESDRAVVAEEQGRRDIADGGPRPPCMPTDDEHQLVLRRGDPVRRRLLLAPPEEVAQPRPQVEEAPVVIVGKLWVHRYIVTR